MSSVIDCTRLFTREDLNCSTWKEFLTLHNDTPFVFECHDGGELGLAENVVAYITDVEFNDGGFTYKLHLTTPSLTEEIFLENYTLEPVYMHIYRAGKIVSSAVYALEMVKTVH